MGRCDEYGVEFMLKTRAQHLLRGEDGAVCGVTAVDKDGEEITVNAKAVVLATGSISANKELIKRFYRGEGL